MVRTRAQRRADDAAAQAIAQANAQEALQLKAAQVNARQDARLAAHERAAQPQATDEASNQPEQGTDRRRSNQRAASNPGGAARSSASNLNSADARDQRLESISSGFHVPKEADEGQDVVESGSSGSRKRRSSKAPDSAPYRPSSRRRLSASASGSLIVDSSDNDNPVIDSSSIQAVQTEQQQNISPASVDAIQDNHPERRQDDFEDDNGNPAVSEVALTSDQIWARRLADVGESSRRMLMETADERAKMASESAKKKVAAPEAPLERKESSIAEFRFFQEHDTQREHRREMYKSHPPEFAEDQTWLGGVFLGEGGMGVAMAYARIDDSNRVIDNVVVKDSWIHPADWASFSTWDGDLRQYNDPKADVLPWEISSLRRVFMRPGSQHIIRMRGYQVDLLRAHYRIYTEYCDLGTLQGSFQRHGHKREPFSEDALWAIFGGLVAAIRTLAYGALNPGDDFGGYSSEELEKWRSIIHRDFKPANVFIQTKRTGDQPHHPIVKLGDFGLSFATTEDDVLNPIAYNLGIGTKHWRAPEQFKWSRSGVEVERNYVFDEATNVWGVGAMMVRLLSFPVQGELEGGDEDPYPVQPVVGLKAKRIYSLDIIDLAEMCCRFRPSDRIDLEDLSKIIDNRTAHYPWKQAGEDPRGWLTHRDKLINDLKLVYAD